MGTIWLQVVVLALLGVISKNAQSSQPPNCDPEHPFMAAGDFNLTQANFEQMLKKHQFVLISATSSKDCEFCCTYEKTISQIRERNFLNESSLFFEYKIKVGRIDMAKETWFSNLHPNFRVLPSWIIYVRGEPFYIQNYHIIPRLLNGVARVVEPYEFIQSIAGFERFMNHTRTDITGRHIVRNKIVGLFSEPDDYEEEIDNFKRTSLQSYWREDSLFALVTSKQVVNEIYRKYGPRYLPNQYDKNSVFFLKLKNRFANKEELKLVDFSKIGDLPSWLAKSSVSPMEEMSSLNQFAFSTKAPMLVAFVDPVKEIQTQAFLDQLEYLGTKYLNRVNFVWVDYRDNLQLMKRLGVEGLA
jgi:Thioredoxin-like domain